MRRLGNKPLIAYPIEKALKLKDILYNHHFDIVVSSDDEYIEEYVSLYPDVEFIKREEKFSKDETPLDPVVYDAFLRSSTPYDYDFVVTLVPTMPLLSVDTMIKAIKKYLSQKRYKSLILVKDATHIYWQNDKLLTKRKNRQFLDPVYEECGGIIITPARVLKTHKQILTKKPCLFVCPPDESVDINSWFDFVLAEKLLNRKRIGFKVGGSHKAGLGHVYRCINLALRFIEHEIYFFIDERDKEAIDAVNSFFFKVIEYYNNDNLLCQVCKHNVDIIINDTLGVDINFARSVNQYLIPIIGFDEPNKDYCALTINPQLEFTDISEENLYGYKYSVIREDVLMFPIKKYPDKIENILVTMGGSDPEGATLTVMNFLKTEENVTVIVGKYFSDRLKKQINKLSYEHSNFKLVTDVKFMGSYLFNADIVITSNSSTVYDCVCLGTFIIAVDKVKDEMIHLFSRLSRATMYLGYHETISKKSFKKALSWLSYDVPTKLEYYDSLVKYANEIRDGQQIVKEKINEVINR